MSEPAKTPLKHFPVTWDELHRHARALAWRLLDLGPWRGIIAITRGGLVPAAIVARELDIRLIDTFCVASYNDRELGESVVLKAVSGDGAGMVNIPALKGIHYAIEAGRLAAEAAFASLKSEPASTTALASYDDAVRSSFIWQDLYEVRDMRQVFGRGFFAGAAFAGAMTLSKGPLIPTSVWYAVPPGRIRVSAVGMWV